METENTPLSKYTASFGLSVAICSILNALLVIAKEKSPGVQAGLKKFAGHHWTGHSIIIISLFFLIGLLFPLLNRGRGAVLSAKTLTRVAVSGIILSALIIIGFYLFAD
jgi:hypothetical protein